MADSANDPMWGEFGPLWRRLQAAGRGVLVGGGYGLFLKQNWLLSRPRLPTVVRLDAWNDASPRATKDLDIVLGLEIVSSRGSQRLISDALKEQGFDEIRPRWQFAKKEGERTTVVDLHSPVPEEPHPNLAMDRVRVKHKPSLGAEGVHGRQNVEAVGSDLHPVIFETNGLKVRVPNPVTWSVMKLCAMRDRLRKSEENDRAEEGRTFEREQAMKHARDVCRIVAMTTREESDRAAEVVEAVKSSAAFTNAVEIRNAFFGGGNDWGTRVVQSAWRTDDLKIIRSVLTSWFA